jgi:ribosomal protein S27AE
MFDMCFYTDREYLKPGSFLFKNEWWDYRNKKLRNNKCPVCNNKLVLTPHADFGICSGCERVFNLR